MRWPKYWSFSFSIIPPKEIPGLISFRMDWLDLLAVQRTLILILASPHIWRSTKSLHGNIKKSDMIEQLNKNNTVLTIT